MSEIRAFRNSCAALAALAVACLAFLALAGTASAVAFSPASSLPVGGWPLSVVSADFNGDGKADLASGNAVPATISVLLGDGVGGFGAASDFPAGGQPGSIASADFNGDGKQDLATGNIFGNNLSILLGDGAGGFGPASNVSVGGQPLSIVSADFNGDGKADLATGNGSNSVSILLGDGAGGFAPASNLPIGVTIRSIRAADLNGDGKIDLVTANPGSNSVSILLGDGAGGFGPVASFAAGSYPYGVDVGDFNGDGKLDLATANYNSNDVSVLLGDGAGGFGPPINSGPVSGPFSIAAADFDADGNLDVAVTNIEVDTVSVLLGDGTGALGPATIYAVGDNPYSVIAADLNGDGLPDLVASNRFTADLSVLLNTTPIANVAITKTASPANPRPGDTVTYTLEAKNAGTATANDVIITDSVPVGVTFVSADPPCTESMATVTCEIGSLAPGEEKTYEVRATVDPYGAANPNNDHLLDVQKVEAQIDLNAGEQKTISVTCPSGYFATDGSVRIDQIDQGTGDWDAPQVLESRATALGTWQGTVKNTATGRAQAKIFAVCVRQQTGSEAGHSHNLITTGQIWVNHVTLAGIDEATLQCGPGQIAIQPGFTSNVPGGMLYSQPEGNGWKFRFDLKADGNVTYSIRCLTRQVSTNAGHTHDLGLERIWNTVTVGPGNVNEAQLTCKDGSKGIVAGFGLDHGLISLGNDPRPVTRAFKLYNPTDHNLTARLSLLCLGDRTGGEHAPPKTIVNSAYISTSSSETQTSNNMDSATITAEDTDNYTPVPNPPPVKPTPNNPTGGTLPAASPTIGSGIVDEKIEYAGYAPGSATAWITLRCGGPCHGTARLLSGTTVKVGGSKVKKGSLLATGHYKLSKSGKKKVWLKVNRRGRRVLRRTGRKGLVKLSSGSIKGVRIGP